MEPAVRGARIESAIGSDAGRSLHLIGLVSLETVPPGTEFLDTETGGQKSTRAAVIVGRDRELKNRRQECRQKRPVSDRRRFPQFGKTGWWRPSGPNCLLPTQSSKPVSDTRVRNGIFCCRDRAAKRAHSARLQEQRPR